MGRILLIYFCVSFPLSLQYWSHMHHQHDRVGYADKIRMKNISEEIVIEAQLKLRQLNDIRDDHSNSQAFDVGLIMGNIRERYRRMVEFYREYRDKDSGRSVFYPTGYDFKFFPVYYILAMERVHALEVDIDKLVHVLESIDSEYVNPDPRYIGMMTTRRRWLRTDEVNLIERMAEEQELKSRAREAHLMRRLGREERGHTTGKRFQHQWPVEKNWELGEYGDMGIFS